MKWTMLLLCSLKVFVGVAQDTTIAYYKDVYCTKEVAQSKATYSESIIRWPDATVFVERRKLGADEVIYRTGVKNQEQVGTWINTNYSGERDTLDFNFELVYDKSPCPDTLVSLSLTQPTGDATYTLPVIAGNTPIFSVIAKKIYYPRMAIENGIEGTIYLRFTIDTAGNVQDVVVARGVYIQMDKEAVRVVRSIKFAEPTKVNGTPVEACFTFPLKFSLDD